MFYIVLSKKEEYLNAADRIVDLCNRSFFAIDLVDIEDLDTTHIASGDGVFFLTNEINVRSIVKDLLSGGITVINGRYLTGEHTKSDTQHRLHTIGISVPKITSTIKSWHTKKDIDIPTFPVYIKSENHSHDVHRVENHEDYNRIISGLDRTLDWYAEDAVDRQDHTLQKVYWVVDYCFARDGEPTPRKDIESAMAKIGREIPFDVFSSDFIVSDQCYWCIDVNPAPALYWSTDARAAFVNHIRLLN